MRTIAGLQKQFNKQRSELKQKMLDYVEAEKKKGVNVGQQQQHQQQDGGASGDGKVVNPIPFADKFSMSLEEESFKEEKAIETMRNDNDNNSDNNSEKDSIDMADLLNANNNITVNQLLEEEMQETKKNESNNREIEEKELSLFCQKTMDELLHGQWSFLKEKNSYRIFSPEKFVGNNNIENMIHTFNKNKKERFMQRLYQVLIALAIPCLIFPIMLAYKQSVIRMLG